MVPIGSDAGGDAAIKAPDSVPKRRRWLTYAGIAAAAAGVVGLLDFPSKINSFADEWPKASARIGDALFLDESFTGIWISENTNVDAASHANDVAALPGGPVAITMRVYRGEATGEVVSDGLKNIWVYSKVSFEGRKKGNAVQGVVWDWVSGEKRPIAVVEIEPHPTDRKVLRFRVMRQGAAFLPATANLYRVAERDMPEGEVNQRLMRKVVEELTSGTK